MMEFINLIATTEVEGGQPTDTISTPEVEAQQQEQPVAEVTEQEPLKYNIDGEEFDLDTIREWKRGNLRQSDYTRKTQEISKMRKESKEALEVYSYLMNKPHLLEKLIELDTGEDVSEIKGKLDPVQKEIQDLKTQMRVKDIDAELSSITSKDKLVTDVELLEIATKQNCDINTAYNIWKGNNFDRIMQDKEKSLRAKITEEIQKNQTITKTLINPTDSAPTEETYGLSDSELAMCDRLGMTPKEYSIYKNPNFKMK